MTTGSSTHSNHSALPPRDDRETLSALFDGELPGDAARFALKRLDHDAQWRETCGRWQLIGDALRGEATTAAPPHFAAGVMRALAEERHAGQVAASSDSAASPGEPARAVSPRRWLGGAALAASVAVAAVLVVRPFQNETAAGRISAGTISAGTLSSRPIATDPVSAPARDATAAAAIRPASEFASAPASRSAASTSSSTRIAVAASDASPPVARPARSPAQFGSRTSRNNAEPRQARVESIAAVAEPNAAHQPFHPPADEVVTRPWPRPALSDGTAAGAFTVGFGQESVASPSLYPFEPRLPQATAPGRPEPAESQH